MMIKISVMAMLHKRGGLTGRAQWVGFFSSIFGGFGLILKKSQVAGGLGSGGSAEIFDGVFLGTLFTLGYFQVFWVIRVYLMFRFTRYVRYT